MSSSKSNEIAKAPAFGPRLAYKIAEAAQIAGVSAWTIHSAIAESRLVARKLGKAWLILHSDLEYFLQNLEPASPATTWLEKRKSQKVAA